MFAHAYVVTRLTEGRDGKLSDLVLALILDTLMQEQHLSCLRTAS